MVILTIDYWLLDTISPFVTMDTYWLLTLVTSDYGYCIYIYTVYTFTIELGYNYGYLGYWLCSLTIIHMTIMDDCCLLLPITVRLLVILLTTVAIDYGWLLTLWLVVWNIFYFPIYWE